MYKAEAVRIARHIRVIGIVEPAVGYDIDVKLFAVGSDISVEHIRTLALAGFVLIHRVTFAKEIELLRIVVELILAHIEVGVLYRYVKLNGSGLIGFVVTRDVHGERNLVKILTCYYLVDTTKYGEFERVRGYAACACRVGIVDLHFDSATDARASLPIAIRVFERGIVILVEVARRRERLYYD